MPIDDATRASLNAIFDRVYVPEPGKGLTFPETVTQLYELGVTRYRVDFITSTTTAYIGGWAHSYCFPSYAPLLATPTAATPNTNTNGNGADSEPEPEPAPETPTLMARPVLSLRSPLPNGSGPHARHRQPPPLTINTANLMPGTIPWSLDRLRAAIKKAREDAKNSKPDLPTYTRQIIEAGVVDYTCFIEGRKVMYTGCLGEAYSAWFMGAGPDAPLNKGYTPPHMSPIYRRNTMLN